MQCALQAYVFSLAQASPSRCRRYPFLVSLPFPVFVVHPALEQPIRRHLHAGEFHAPVLAVRAQLRGVFWRAHDERRQFRGAFWHGQQV